MSVQGYGAILATDEEDQDHRALLYPSSYQRERVHLLSSKGAGIREENPHDVEEEDNHHSTNVLRSRHCKLVSGILLLALLSFVGSVGWFALGGTSLLDGSEGAEASMMDQQHGWARNPVQRWAHMYPTKSDAVHAKDSHGNKVKATTVIVIKDHDGKNGSCDHDDCHFEEPEPCHQHEKCFGKSMAPVPAPVAAPVALPPTPTVTGAPVPFLDPSCSAVAACAHLMGACCPTEQGVFLHCCGETVTKSPTAAPVTKAPTAAPVPPPKVMESLPTVAPEPKNAACAAVPFCASLHLTGDCCPTKDGMFLECCGQVVETNAPATKPPTEHPTNVPSETSTTQAPTEWDSSCAAYSVCTDLQLTGDCCPTVDNVYLECCFETSSPSSSPTEQPTTLLESGGEAPPTASPTDPTCASHFACAHLQGDCCPTMDGMVLDCCSVTKEPTTAPSKSPSGIPTEVPTNEPSSAPTLLPSSFPTMFPSVEPTEAPIIHSASCAAHPACAHLHGDCCPTRHSHRFLKCCSVTDEPAPSPTETPSEPPTAAPLAAIVGSPTTASPVVLGGESSLGKGHIHHHSFVSKESKMSKEKYAKASKGLAKQAKAKQGPISAKWAKAAKTGKQSKRTSKY